MKAENLSKFQKMFPFLRLVSENETSFIVEEPAEYVMAKDGPLHEKSNHLMKHLSERKMDYYYSGIGPFLIHVYSKG